MINWKVLKRWSPSWLGLEHLPYEEMLKVWALLRLEMRCLRGPDSSLIMPKIGLARTQRWATTVVHGESTRHSRLKLNEGRF